MTDKTQPTPDDGSHPGGETKPAAETTPPVQSLLGRFGPRIGGRTGVYYGVLVHLLVLAVLGVGLFYAWAWLAPHMVETYRTAQRGIAQGSADSLPPGRSGLIYVESPEVYTRQRLVNDRYLQDAWLNERLAEIDDTAGWIDSAYVSELLAIAQLGVGQTDGASRRNGTPEPVALPPDIAEQLSEIPFQTRFRLQSQARDNIRQLILENALDDRHDLSGNTIFGLKFDTSILTADNTHLNPTVAVRMCPSQLDQLLRRGPIEERGGCYPAIGDLGPHEAPADQPERTTEEFIAHFLRFAGLGYVSFEWEPRTREILNGVDDNYDRWRENVQQRLESFERSSGAVGCGETAPPPEDTAFLCGNDDAVSMAALAEIRGRLGNTPTLDGALQHVMRLTDVETNIEDLIFDALEDNAIAICRARPEALAQFGLDEDGRAAITVREFLLDEQYHNLEGIQFSIPGAWGAYSRAFITFRFPGDGGREERDACPVEFALELEEPEDSVFSIVRLPDESAEEQYQAVVSMIQRSGFKALRCDGCPFAIFVIGADGTSPDLQRFSEATLRKIGEVVGFAAPARPLSRPAQDAVEAAAEAARDWRICATTGREGEPNRNLLYLDPAGEEERRWEEFGFTLNTRNCISGRRVWFRTGAYEFFRSMTEVESYTYAAFPRGDVSGVVRQVHTQTGLDLASALSSAGARLGLTSGTTERSFEEQPIVVNFASGQNRYRGTAQAGTPGLFDFGWSIVRTGAKEPMMTSQLVLVSVPAYLERITLEYWTGFLDLNRIPADRDAPFDGDRSFNHLTFEERVAALMDGEEARTMTLRVPPDFAALDSIVIGRNEAFGPKIREGQSCIAKRVDGNLSAIIPGDRLWRSTVVTLGTERADRIEVMPDMNGIRATFQMRCAEDAPNCDNDQRSRAAAALLSDIGRGLDLRVWTSEGSDVVTARLCR